jgi:nitroimidazol reductase NimA-like FMN-containing flavoprotein (pyridoxamine 5'-phosphate oxidase superfamily)
VIESIADNKPELQQEGEMIEIRDLGDDEIRAVITRNGYAHLGCSRDNFPYVVPIHYGYDEPYIYIFTTQGKKTEILSRNPRICLQIEEVADAKNWVSVIINGEAEELIDEEGRDEALKVVTKTNPELTPAVSIRWMDSWIRENISVHYRITPLTMTGRASVPGSEIRTPFVPRPHEQRVL